jgi:LPXTG-site transpeptidase (sortase) family protein
MIFVGSIVVFAALVFGVTAAQAVLYPGLLDTQVEVPPHNFNEHTHPGGSPLRISIPALGVDAAVIDVGIAKSGHMAVPQSFTEVGWYRYGPAPGELGSAVMAGHVDNGLGLKAVFARLDELNIGNDIYVTMSDGRKLHFVVSDIEVYAYQSVPSSVVFGQQDTARLNLITCEGAWVQGDKTYDHRVVIFSTLVS